MASSDDAVNYKREHTGKLVASRKHVLHPPDCENSEKDIALMQLKLRKDPECLERENDQYVCGEYLKPLAQAVYKGHEKCVEFLINPGGDIKNYSRHSIGKIIYYAIEYRRENILEYFLTHKLYRSLAMLKLGTSYLHYAVMNESDLKIIDMLIRHGGLVDYFNYFTIELNEYSITCPAAAAILKAQPSILKHLLLHGAVVDHRQTGRTDLSPEVKDCLSLIHHFAAIAFFDIQNNIQILTMLHELGANLWERNRHGLTPVEVRQNPDFLAREVNARDEIFQIYYYESRDNVEELEEITKKMSELMVQPLKLSSWCRVSLVRSMGVKYLENIDKLTPQDLPAHIRDFLRGDDLKSAWY